MSRVLIRAAMMESENQRLRADADRYRWLRDVNNMRARELFLYYGDVDPRELDAAIDAAMARKMMTERGEA